MLEYYFPVAVFVQLIRAKMGVTFLSLLFLGMLSPGERWFCFFLVIPRQINDESLKILGGMNFDYLEFIYFYKQFMT
jgi:hypothetical protein